MVPVDTVIAGSGVVPRAAIGARVRVRRAATRRRPQSRECRVCLGLHDEEIHAATVRIRQWFRSQVVKAFLPAV